MVWEQLKAGPILTAQEWSATVARSTTNIDTVTPISRSDEKGHSAAVPF
jgi:hypothetical protein